METYQVIEFIAAALVLLNVYLLTKEKLLAWPVGLVAVAIYIYIFATAKLYSDMILQGVFVLLNIYGWWYWTNKKNDHNLLSESKKETPILRLTMKATTIWIVVIAIGTFIWGYFMQKNTDASYAYWDAFTTVTSLVAQYLIAKKVLENWIFWIVVDVVAVNIYFLKGLYITTGLYFILLLLCIKGYLDWKKSLGLKHNTKIN